MGLRDHIRRLERSAKGEMIAIPQQDGGIKRFPKREMAHAYLSTLERSLGRDVAEHPMLAAIRNGSDPKWRNAWADLLDRDPDARSVEDLSEG
jgi:hypothetical protein